MHFMQIHIINKIGYLKYFISFIIEVIYLFYYEDRTRVHTQKISTSKKIN